MTFLGIVWLIVKVLYLLSVAIVGYLLGQDGEQYVEITHPIGRFRVVRFLAYTVVAVGWPILFLVSLRFVPRSER